MMASGVNIMPLLQGNIQFGKLVRKHMPFVIEELQLRTNAILSDEDKTKGMRKLIKILKEVVFPPSDTTLTEKQIEERKFFMPLCSRATEWFTNDD